MTLTQHRCHLTLYFHILLLIGCAKYGFNIIVSGHIAWICEEELKKLDYVVYKVTMLTWLLHSSGVWSSVNVRACTKKTCVLEDIGLHVQYLLIIVDLRVIIIGGGG